MGRYDYRELDELVHNRIRLAALSLLATHEEADFTFLRDQVGTTDGNLATHMRRLEDAGWVEKEKVRAGGRSHTTFRITAAGRAAFRAYLDRLEELLPR